jgi:hypothetical protein
MSARSMHRRLDRIRRRHHVGDLDNLSPEEIFHLPDEQLTRIIAKHSGQTVAEIEKQFENFSDQELDEIIRRCEEKLAAQGLSMASLKSSVR